MTAPAKWIEKAEPVIVLPSVPLADWPEGTLAELVGKLNVKAFAALCAAIDEAQNAPEGEQTA